MAQALRFRILVRPVAVTMLILSVPLISMAFTSEVAWDGLDFAVAAALVMGTGLVFELIMRHSNQTIYRLASFVAIFTALLLVWVNLAVGLIGSENNLANLLFLAVLAVGVIGVFKSGLAAAAMARTMLACAAVQLLIALVAVVAGWTPSLMPSALFVGPWLLSAWLYLRGAGAPTEKA